MAAEAPSMPVNGNYGHHGYGVEQAHNPYAAQQNFNQGSQSSAAASATNGQNADIPKDEVGWYFVEQYYTTLSKNPEHLYLYYNKRSQFVSGDETAKVQVCVGQRAINDRIKELNFQDCKVRITNVDSQASDHNIVIQVIGEISNKSQPHRKFTQTFVLATQTNGYFVLNDIFRYIIEEEDEVEPQTETGAQAEETPEPAAEPAPVEQKEEPKTLSSSDDQAAIEHDAKTVDEKIEQKLLDPSAEVNGTHEEEPAVPEIPAAEVSEEPERPTEPEPTPAASPPKQTPAQPAAAPKPAVPKSWAALAAAGVNKVATPKQAPAPAAAQSKAADAKTTPAASAPAAAPTAPASANAAAPTQDAATSESQDEWTAVGGSHNRQQSRQVNGQQTEGPQRKAYIKNVQESIQTTDLKEVLEKFGKVSHVDISRQKVCGCVFGPITPADMLQNCAFVDFETPEGYQAAVAANPHTVGTESFFVEERKLRQGNAPFAPRGAFQGGRGRGEFRGGRGGFNQRGRGQGAARGARGGAQQP
ncbi:hypothetical protein AMS68_002455 [Peltaster fructicola]|uniref:NTF2 domain-containing protein n=1 Tax=Peltaster fructicola TaxID=286661 RepID=A0A6H0XQM2_9PEZI|nr:hypothetical protein AMS68_002455 [Peltaster fructicola]